MWLVVRWFVVLLWYYSVLQKIYNVLLQYYSNVLLCTTKYYASTTLYYNVLLQYYSVLQSTTPVLLQYYSVLRQYYSVLQSTTPVLQRTTTYYSSTTLYYEVLLQYYSVLQSTTSVLLCTTPVLQRTSPVLLQYYSVLQSTMPVLQRTTLYYNILLQYYSVLQSTTLVLLCTTKYYSSTTKYYASTTLYYASTTTYYSGTTFETSFTMRGATRVTVQLHQILRLPRRMNVVDDLRHIWNVISNAWSKERHPPTSPNTAPATQNECHQWSASHMKRHFQCAESVKSPSNLTKYCACHAKCKSSMICVTYETSFPMRGARKGTLQPHQILRLPRKMQVINDLRHIWNVISNARSQSSHPPTSPNTAPATQNASQQWSASHMKRHFQCAEQVKSPCKLTKYCACHAKWMSSMICVTYVTSFPMRGANQVTLQPHQTLRLPRNLEAQDFSRNSLNASANRKTIRR